MTLLTCAEFRVLRDQYALTDYAQRFPMVCALADDYRRQIATLRYEKHDPATSRHRQQAIDAEIYTLAWKLRPWESERLGILADTPVRCKRLGLALPGWYPGEVVKPAEPVAVVVNRRHEQEDIYIGRGSIWGNPFVIDKDGTREEVIAKYRAYILGQPDLLAQLPDLRGKRLGCYCKPERCHGDVLVELLAEMDRKWKAA